MAELIELIKSALECQKYETCMSLYVSEEGDRVELILDTSLDTYSEWIKGEGADIALIRERGSDRVVGCTLPLLNNKLVVSHSGPIKVNEGFLKQ